MGNLLTYFDLYIPRMIFLPAVAQHVVGPRLVCVGASAAREDLIVMPVDVLQVTVEMVGSAEGQRAIWTVNRIRVLWTGCVVAAVYSDGWSRIERWSGIVQYRVDGRRPCIPNIRSG
jgi:hypothetical protein